MVEDTNEQVDKIKKGLEWEYDDTITEIFNMLNDVKFLYPEL